MPWWGWLILICVVLIVTAWMVLGLLGFRAARKMNESFDKHWNDPPFGGRR